MPTHRFSYILDGTFHIMEKTCLSAWVFLSLLAPAFAQTGVFSDQLDVGTVARAGSAVFDSAAGEYRVAGGGENIWNTNDAFHFVWIKLSVDFALAADIRFPQASGSPHRKACLMVRQSLAADAAYVDVAVHGSGLTALQCRDTQNDLTHEIQIAVQAPQRVRLEKHGEYVTMSCGTTGETVESCGAMYRLELKEPFYVGLAVGAHDNHAIEQAIFSKVELETNLADNAKPAVETSLETIAVGSTDRTVVFHSHDHFEAANWSRDGKSFYYNSGGRIYRLPVAGGIPETINTGIAVGCNNDHGLSPDGTQLAVSDGSQGDHQSRVYVLPVGGGPARLITVPGPSYWHGWSPDGKTLAYCGGRHGEFDIYTIPADGGTESRLTTTPGLDDGPDYSADGKYIYFNSVRTGGMQIWRMKSDGSDQEQITFDEYNNWFAHPSPDGRWLVFVSYGKDVHANEHPANKDITLRLMSLETRKIQVLAKLHGGQGTLNVPSWSPDSKFVAFVSYPMAY